MKSSPDLSVWHHKPWWCQPWTIVLTGITIISSSWVLLHTLWVTLLVAVPILAWMIFFVGIYPQKYQQMLENSGSSDKEINPSS
jgi:membrane protein YdbS with pleckstrin-like domain